MNNRIRWMVTTGALAAIEVVLYILGIFISIGLKAIGLTVTINLSLVPIAVGALLLGPWCGLFLGFVNGIAVILTPDTIAIFMSQNIFGTIITCLVKTMAAGFIAGLLFKLFKDRKFEIVGMIICSLLIPIINTSLFTVGCLLFFKDVLGDQSPFLFLISLFIGINFIIEISVSTVLSPAICKIVKIGRRKQEATS